MNYLKICTVISCNEQENYCVGTIEPKIYSDWKQVSPEILFFEGIHQFAVKSVKKMNPKNENKKIVPVQVRNLVCKEFPEYEKLYICGDVMSSGIFYKVNFKVFRKRDSMQIENEIATGVVSVSSLIEEITC